MILTSVSTLLKRALLAGCSVQSFLSIIRPHIAHSPNAGIVYACLLKVGEFPWEEKKEAIHWLLTQYKTMKTECFLACLFLFGDIGLNCDGKNDTSMIDTILEVYLKKWSESLSQQNSGLFLALITGSARFLQSVSRIPLALSSMTQKGMTKLSQLILRPFLVLFDRVNDSLSSRSRRSDSSIRCGVKCHSYIADTGSLQIPEGGETTILHCGLLLSEWMFSQDQKEIGMDLLQIACYFAKQSTQPSLRLVALSTLSQLLPQSDSSICLRMLTLLCNTASYTSPNGVSSSIPIVSNWTLNTLPREMVISTPLHDRIQKILATNKQRNRECFADLSLNNSSMKRLYEKWNQKEILHSPDEWK